MSNDIVIMCGIWYWVICCIMGLRMIVINNVKIKGIMIFVVKWILFRIIISIFSIMMIFRLLSVMIGFVILVFVF